MPFVIDEDVTPTVGSSSVSPESFKETDGSCHSYDISSVISGNITTVTSSSSVAPEFLKKTHEPCQSYSAPYVNSQGNSSN